MTAEHGVEITRYDARACTRQSISVEVGDGGLSARLFGDPGARVVQEAIGPRLDPDEPRHAYARLLATRGGVCEPDSGEDVLADEVPVSSVRFALQALPFTAQRWHRGRPRAQQRVWYPVDELDDQEGEAIAARVIAAPGASRTLRRVGRHELFGAELHGRNGGFALGVFDRVGDRHRWVLVTRACLYGTTLRWLASGEGLVVGYAVSQHPIYAEDGRDGLFVVDLREGRAFRLLLEGSALVWEPCPGGAGTNAGADDDVEDGDEDGACDMSLRAAPTPALIGRFRHGAHALRTRSGARVTLEELRAALDQR
ncbi:MAG: hypothetical protein H6713_29910 [Myxococcales bacterium]|nr:hypothetical protein [Myxococcales bacterium]